MHLSGKHPALMRIFHWVNEPRNLTREQEVFLNVSVKACQNLNLKKMKAHLLSTHLLDFLALFGYTAHMPLFSRISSAERTRWSFTFASQKVTGRNWEKRMQFFHWSLTLQRTLHDNTFFEGAISPLFR